MNSEVLIVGGGVIGLAIARALHKTGAGKITILERGSIGKESSYAAAGMLAPQAEADVADDFFRLCDESNKLYPQFAAELYEETGVDIELDRSGTLYLAFTETDTEEIKRRFAWQIEAGLAVEHLPANEVRKIEPFVSSDVREGLFFPNDWQVENRKLLAALETYAVRNRIEIIENAEVKSLLRQGGKAVGAETASGKFFASKVVFATGAWTSLIKIGDSALPKVSPVRGQMLAYKTQSGYFSA
jgi:glycine oxidase